jgi:hypothetical protein
MIKNDKKTYEALINENRKLKRTNLILSIYVVISLIILLYNTLA